METSEIEVLNKLAAEKVMRWEWIENLKAYYPTEEQLGMSRQISDGIFKKDWTPATNIEQAFMVIREMLRDEKWMIVVRTMYDLDRMSRIWYECLIWKRDSETFYGEALIDQPALAILRCVAKTIEEKNDKTR